MKVWITKDGYGNYLLSESRPVIIEKKGQQNVEVGASSVVFSTLADVFHIKFPENTYEVVCYDIEVSKLNKDTI